MISLLFVRFVPLGLYAGTKARSPLRYQLHSVEDRAKCPTVPQICELVIGTRVAGQGSK